MKIYCRSNISDAKLKHFAYIADYHNIDKKSCIFHTPDLMHPNLIRCLKDCLDLFNGLMSNSYTNDPDSHIIQVLFIQQLKITVMALSLIKNKYTVGQEALTRIAFETYIKIKWLIMGDYKNKNEKKRFNKFVRSESLNVAKQLKYYKKCISRLKKRGHLDKSKEQLISAKLRKFNYLKEIDENNLKAEGVSNINNLINSKINRLSIKNMTDKRNYKIFRWLCSEVHSNIINLLSVNTDNDNNGKYVSNLNIDEYPNFPDRISNLVIILVNSFLIINSKNIFVNEELPMIFYKARIKTIYDIAQALRNYAIVFHYGYLSDK